MNKTNHKDGYDPVQIMARVIAYLPKILLRSGTAWLSYKRNAKKGGKTFQKELIRRGVDKETAMRFTDQYTSSSNLIRIILNRS